MRNLSVRTKILLGFGASIMMLLVIAGVFLFSNVQTSGNLHEVKFFTDLQSACKAFTFHYLEASIEAESAHKTKGDQVYSDLIRQMDLAYADLEDMASSSFDHPEYRNEIERLEGFFAAWEQSIVAVQGNDRALQNAVVAARSHQEALRLTADATYQNQQALWQEETQEDTTAEDKLRRAGRLDETVVFIRDIENLIRVGESIYRTYDVESVNAFLAETGRIIAAVQENGDIARNQGTKDTAYATVDALQAYKGAMEAFDAINKQNQSLILESQRLGNLASTSAGAFLDKLAISVNSNVDRTVSDNQTLLTIVLVVALVAASVAIGIAFYLSGMISKPLALLTAFMKKAGATGDISFKPEDWEAINAYAQIKDEIGQTIAGCVLFIQHVTHIAQELETVASGDLTTEAELLSEADVMGKALVHMIDSLNKLFVGIHAASAQVSSGSRQIADGAQILAQGSTEQAAAIEELSASIAEIAQRTKENAATAEQTAKLSEAMRDGAEKGSRQMGEMIAAVRQINEASQSISRIIKTIDEIAFQTNILALNAAVEAARAGQAGKGFAVVAEEVRNLASKSAEAAKDTGAMIQDSIEKAELGSHIADETSESLHRIVANIGESNQLSEAIARSSQEQSLGIAQINIGIEQVAQVVQQNTATAEEEAAASEEMSGQSRILQELIAQFKLKDGRGKE
ncbi:MAG: methyl-accepting chemotaxis protein [Clostridiales bacterium]|nr:methyl-accepting chemotaxis protein [Clostridiales bacterium]